MASGQWRPVKPRKPILNGEHPLTRGLVFDSLLFERGGTSPLNLAGQLKGTFAGAPAWITDKYGAALSFSGASDQVSYSLPSTSPMESMAVMSYECMVNMTGLGGGSVGYVVMKGPGGGAPYFLISASSVPGLQILAVWTTTNGSWTVPMTENAWHHVVVTYVMNVSATPVVYIDGVQVTVTTAQAPAGSAPSDSASVWIGNNGSGTRNWAGYISHVRAWKRLLTQSEVTDLSENPWCFYRQQPVLLGAT